MSEKMEDGGPAFPRPDWNGSWVGPDTFSGLSLRDWFAGQALAGVIDVCRSDTVGIGETREELFAWKAYRIADAMLAARAAKET